MRKLKILHVVNSLDPGGMENGVINIINALSRDFEFQVACLERLGAFSQRLANPHDAWVVGKTNGFSPLAAVRLGLKIRQLKPDVIHTHNLGPLIYSALATLGGMTKPILHGEHSQLTEQERCPRRLRQRRLFYRFCREIHTVSRAQKEELLGMGFLNITSIINGVDVERFVPGPAQPARKQFGIPEDSVVMGIVGRFGPFKRHSVLLNAFEKLAPIYPSLRVLVVGGGGPEENRVRQQAEESQWRDRIQFAGFQNEPTCFYQAMDFLIVPSVNEGLSNAILEAMGCGIPVLAHTACGNEEVITSGKEGMVSDLGSAELICTAVASMMERQSEFSEWGGNGRRRVVQHFSLNRMMNGYANLYHTLASAEST